MTPTMVKEAICILRDGRENKNEAKDRDITSRPMRGCRGLKKPKPRDAAASRAD